MQTKVQIIVDVLTTRRYASVAVLSGTGLGIIYYLLTMSMLPAHMETGVLDSAATYLAASIALTATISALAGINFALMALKIKRARMMMNVTAATARTPGTSSARANLTALLGGVFAAFTPGCPACTAPLAVILGTVGGLSLFPMQGLELKILSVGVLLASIWWVARGLQKRSCCKIG